MADFIIHITLAILPQTMDMLVICQVSGSPESLGYATRIITGCNGKLTGGAGFIAKAGSASCYQVFQQFVKGPRPASFRDPIPYFDFNFTTREKASFSNHDNRQYEPAFLRVSIVATISAAYRII